VGLYALDGLLGFSVGWFGCFCVSGVIGFSGVLSLVFLYTFGVVVSFCIIRVCLERLRFL
jgi:hypothetical protein